MAVLEHTRPIAIFSRPTLTAPFRTLMSVLNDWNDARVTHKALSKLSDRELDDVGLKRSDISRVVSGAYR